MRLPTILMLYKIRDLKELHVFLLQQRSLFSSALTNDAFLQEESEKTKEIKLFLQQRNLKIIDGWTCYQCTNMLQQLHNSGTSKNFHASLSNYFINKTTGDFHCPQSGHQGSWKSFQKLCVPDKESEKGYRDLLQKFKNTCTSFDVEMEKIWAESPKLSSMQFGQVKNVMNFFQLSGLDLSFFSKYDIRCTKHADKLIIPFYRPGVFHKQENSKPTLLGLKIIHDGKYSLDENCNSPGKAYKLYPENDFVGLFGYNEVGLGKASIVLTANEFDAMAINAASKRLSAVALPLGITTLPVAVLPLLEQFSEIILWFGSSLLSIEAAELFARKLGNKRCKIVRSQCTGTTAMLALKHGLNIERIASTAVSADMKNVLSFSDLSSEVKDELSNKAKFAGIPFKRFWNLNRKLKGHRRGELTVLTGPTGSGKTTLLSELSLDLASQGVNTLWGSFEISNRKLLTCMLKQFSRLHLESHIDQFNDVSEKFKQLPIKLMSYNGPENVNDVLATMHNVTYTNDIHHIIIDNLQFMLGANTKMDRFFYQDYVISKFRQFATKYHLHLTLVVHPRKEDSNMPLQLSSVFGSARATQEADNVLIVQQIKIQSNPDKPAVTNKYLEVAKNRYDGDLGRIKLYFNRNTLCMSPDPIVDTTEVGRQVFDANSSNDSTPTYTKPELSINYSDTPSEEENQSWIRNFRT